MMETIWKYILLMIPYMLMIIPAYLILRFNILKRRNALSKLNLHHEIVLLVFIAFISGLASVTVLPSYETIQSAIDNNGHINLIPFKVILEQFKELGSVAFIINILGNIVIFIPFGFFPALLWKNFSLLQSILLGFSVSLFIELVQLHIGRNTDVDDLILNTLGAVFGYLVYKLFYKFLPSRTEKFKINNLLE